VEIFISKNLTNNNDLAPTTVNQLLTSARVFTQQSISWTGYLTPTDYISFGGYTDFTVTLTENCELTIALVDGAEGPTGLRGPTGTTSPWTQDNSNVYYAGGNVGIGNTTPDLLLSVGAYGGMATGATFSLTGTSSTTTSLTLPVGSCYLVSCATRTTALNGNEQWHSTAIVQYISSSFVGHVVPISANNITLTCSTAGQITVTATGGAGTYTATVNAIRIC
jgi:hypothetical protein